MSSCNFPKSNRVKKDYEKKNYCDFYTTFKKLGNEYFCTNFAAFYHLDISLEIQN